MATIEITQDELTWKRNSDWMVIVRLMRQADEGDKAALTRLNEEYKMNYKPKTTAETLKKEVLEAIEERVNKKTR